MPLFELAEQLATPRTTRRRLFFGAASRPTGHLTTGGRATIRGTLRIKGGWTIATVQSRKAREIKRVCSASLVRFRQGTQLDQKCVRDSGWVYFEPPDSIPLAVLARVVG